MKVTKEQIKEMNELYSKGKTQTEIAGIFEMSQSLVSYWVNPKSRKKHIKRASEWFKNLSEKKRKELRDKNREERREYRRVYFSKKYKEDLEHREKMKKWSRDYQRKKRGVGK